MCGVAAIYAYHDAAGAVDRDELRTIRDRMAARGPDGAGEWYSGDGRVGLGHRRLAIIDLSERAAQPMVSADGRYVVSFNGEIYNYRELRAGLEGEGCRFVSDSDTEVLLQLYAFKGEAMLPALRGMFAFALWDTQAQTLLLARDPYGIKPLYYADDGWTVRVASQVKALLASPRVGRGLDPAGAVGFYLLGSVPEPFTAYGGIRAVPAGSHLVWGTAGRSEAVAYFSVAATLREAVSGGRADGKAPLEALTREALLDSVRHHMVADVPVGAFLSSGVDSGALVGLMCEAGGAPVSTTTVAFEAFRGHAEDEAPLAEDVARRYGSDHRTCVVSNADVDEALDAFVDAMDQPSIDGLNTWLVSRAVHRRGIKVAVSGVGGDELFGGYPSFTSIPRWVRLAGPPARVPGLGRLARWLTARASASLGRPKTAGLLEYAGSFPGADLLRRGLFMPWELEALLDADVVEAGLARLAPLAHIGAAIDPDPGSDFGRVAALEASLYLRNQLLRDADWAGMAHSLEIRTPLVDAWLLRVLAPVLAPAASGSRKALLAASPRPILPAPVRARAKTGFTLPIADWLRRLDALDAWRRVPALAAPSCHWARRLAYVVMAPIAGPTHV